MGEQLAISRRATESVATANSHRASRAVAGLARLVVTILLWAGGISSLVPFFWMVTTALKPDYDIYVYPPRWLPSHWDFANYSEMWHRANFSHYFLNSFIYAGSVTVLTLFFSSLAGYAFARLRFPGREQIFFLLLTSLMVPGQVTMIPIFLMIMKVPFAGGNNFLGQGGTGWLNTFPGLIVPHMGSVFGMFLIRQFVQSLPYDLDDAARIDGCSEFRIYWNIIMPLSKTVLATLGLFTFQATWNDFLWPLVITNTQKIMTIQIGLQMFRDTTGGEPEWALLMAGSTLAMLPTLVVFLLGQRYFIRGIALSGIRA